MTPDHADAARKKVLHASEIPEPTGDRCKRCTKPVREDGHAGYCSADCFRAAVKTISQAKLRTLVFERDKGVCALCGEDMGRLEAVLRELTSQALAASSMPRSRENDRLARDAGRRLQSFQHGLVVRKFDRDAVCNGSLWEADHVNPRVKGGATTLENARTLCVPCHKKVTKDLARERRRPRG